MWTKAIIEEAEITKIEKQSDTKVEFKPKKETRLETPSKIKKLLQLYNSSAFRVSLK